MILYYLAYLLITLAAFLLAIFEPVTDFPVLGTVALYEYMSYVKAFVEIFWPLNAIVGAFLWYLVFRITMLIVRFALGSRIPKAVE